MNEMTNAQGTKLFAQIIAVTFVQFNPTDYTLLPDPKARIYFYLDPHGVEKGDFAMVWVEGRDNSFGMVHVERCISVSDPYAAEKVTKPILGKFEYNSDVVSKAFADIQGLQKASRDEAIQRSIDHALNLRRDGQPTEARIKRLGLFEDRDGSIRGTAKIDRDHSPSAPSYPFADLPTTYKESEMVSLEEAKRRYNAEFGAGGWEVTDKNFWRNHYFQFPESKDKK